MSRPAKSPATPDIAVIGAGIVGLWTAYHAANQGLSVLLIDADEPGKGASNGHLGALMPHQPSGWNAKKQFQLDGLLSLPREIAQLEAETGMTVGYRRCGRVMPIAHPEKRRQSMTWVEGSRAHWPDSFNWDMTDTNPAPGWLREDPAVVGYNQDTLSACVPPRRLMAMLLDAINSRNNISLSAQTIVSKLDFDKSLYLSDGERVSAGKVIIAAGTGAFPLIDALTGINGTGSAVKGQSALFKPASPLPGNTPVIYDNGTYIIAHGDGTIAVGSTSENEFDDPSSTDLLLEQRIAHAKRLCPALEDAEILDRWAGLRPKAAGRDPMIGPLPGAEKIIAATGGFKITFAIAHLMAKAALGMDGIRIPQAFLPQSHLDAARRKAPKITPR